MRVKRFHLSHSLIGALVVLIIEQIALLVLKDSALIIGLVLVGSFIGACGIIIIATEVIKEVKNADHMLLLLSIVIGEFIVFFAFQYDFFSVVLPGSFQGLVRDPISLLLNSTMIFALNPLYLPTTVAAKMLLLINTLSSLAVVLFVLQNIWQFRGKTSSSNHL